MFKQTEFFAVFLVLVMLSPVFSAGENQYSEIHAMGEKLAEMTEVMERVLSQMNRSD